MANRKILYGYLITHGELLIREDECMIVQNVYTSYLARTILSISGGPIERRRHSLLPGVATLEQAQDQADAGKSPLYWERRIPHHH